MTDIIIYTMPETLNHKKGLKEGEEEFDEFYWRFPRMPKKLKENDRIYFATKRFIRGYFILRDMDDEQITWDCDSWVDIKPIPTKSFQGFKYVDKVEELNGIE